MKLNITAGNINMEDIKIEADSPEFKVPCDDWTKCPYAKSVYEGWEGETYECLACHDRWKIYDDEIR